MAMTLSCEQKKMPFAKLWCEILGLDLALDFNKLTMDQMHDAITFVFEWQCGEEGERFVIHHGTKLIKRFFSTGTTYIILTSDIQMIMSPTFNDVPVEYLSEIFQVLEKDAKNMDGDEPIEPIQSVAERQTA